MAFQRELAAETAGGSADLRECTVPEAARALGVSEEKLRGWLAAGLLPARRDGERWMVALPARLLGAAGRAPVYATLPLDVDAIEDGEPIAGTPAMDLPATREELDWYIRSKLAAKDVEIEDLWRVVEGLARDRDVLEQRLRAGPSARGWRLGEYGVVQVVVAVLLGLALLLAADYFIDGDAIPLLPERASEGLAPALPAASASATEASASLPQVSAAGAPAANATAADVLRQIAAAESTLRTGQMDVTIDDRTAGRSTRQVRFDLGDQQHSPRFFSTTRAGQGDEPAIERVTIGDRTWERTSGGAWMAQTTQQSVLAQILPFMPPLNSAASPELASEAGANVLRWHDPKSDIDITLVVDRQTGVPRELRQVARGTGGALTVAYTGWNAPVKIDAPDGA